MEETLVPVVQVDTNRLGVVVIGLSEELSGELPLVPLSPCRSSASLSFKAVSLLYRWPEDG